MFIFKNSGYIENIFYRVSIVLSRLFLKLKLFYIIL